MEVQTLKWKLAPNVAAHPEKYMDVELPPARVLELWRSSIVAYEWLDQGQPKPLEKLNPNLKDEYEMILKALKDGTEIEQPLLGIGIFDSLEVGMGRATICALAAANVPVLRMSLPVSMEKAYRKLVK
ncbi:MAG: hypothetical protein AB7E85_07350 [Pseudobdellovibrionaceae bacterium]